MRKRRGSLLRWYERIEREIEIKSDRKRSEEDSLGSKWAQWKKRYEKRKEMLTQVEMRVDEEERENHQGNEWTTRQERKEGGGGWRRRRKWRWGRGVGFCGHKTHTKNDRGSRSFSSSPFLFFLFSCIFMSSFFLSTEVDFLFLPFQETSQVAGEGNEAVRSTEWSIKDMRRKRRGGKEEEAWGWRWHRGYNETSRKNIVEKIGRRDNNTYEEIRENSFLFLLP